MELAQLERKIVLNLVNHVVYNKSVVHDVILILPIIPFGIRPKGALAITIFIYRPLRLKTTSKNFKNIFNFNLNSNESKIVLNFVKYVMNIKASFNLRTVWANVIRSFDMNDRFFLYHLFFIHLLQENSIMRYSSMEYLFRLKL